MACDAAIGLPFGKSCQGTALTLRCGGRAYAPEDYRVKDPISAKALSAPKPTDESDAGCAEAARGTKLPDARASKLLPVLVVSEKNELIGLYLQSWMAAILLQHLISEDPSI